MIIGLNRDEQFGTVIMAGLGGIWTEALKDVSFRAVPITHDNALAMINELRMAPLLKGGRGQPGADLNALADIMVKVSYLGQALGERLKELDINPLLVFSAGQGAKVLDATLVLQGETG
jgi:acyl-CoA synthetase (NDP forming)